MARTQLQLRIDEFVRTGERFPLDTSFLDLGEFGLEDYRNRDFIDENRYLSRHILEEEVKTGKSYKDIHPAVQTRLACMEFENDLKGEIKKYQESGFSRIVYFKGVLNLMGIHLRNNRMREKAVKRVYSEKGGFFGCIRNETREYLIGKLLKDVVFLTSGK